MMNEPEASCSLGPKTFFFLSRCPDGEGRGVGGGYASGEQEGRYFTGVRERSGRETEKKGERKSERERERWGRGSGEGGMME